MLPGSNVVVTLKVLHQVSAAAGPVMDVPFPVLAAEAVPHSNVLQFCPTTLAPLPGALMDAVAAAGGALSFGVALHLPEDDSPAVTAGGMVEGSCVCWAGAAPRVWLSPQRVAAIKVRVRA